MPSDSSCVSDFGTPPACDNSGQILSESSSIVRIADLQSETDAEVEDDVCSFRGLDSVYSNNRESSAGLRWQYFATQSGVHRQYPGLLWGTSADDGQCSDYDPRGRPWYVAASSGPKNVIIVVDDSASMGQSIAGSSVLRIERARDAAISVIETLTQADYFNVVRFSNAVGSWNPSFMVRATEENRLDAIRWVENQISARGSSTQYHLGIREAYGLLRNSIENDQENSRHTDCLSTVLFLTDGRASDEAMGVTELLQNQDLIDGTSSFPPTSLFTYSFGSEDLLNLDDSRNFAKQMACAGRGVWAGVEAFTELRTAMSQYYSFLAAGQQRDNQVVWTEPYEDATGLRDIVTAALPVYDQRQVLVGVAGVDIALADFGVGVDTTLLNFLAARSAACASVQLSACSLQQLREVQNERYRVRAQAAGTTTSLDSVCRYSTNATDSLYAPDLSCGSTQDEELEQCSTPIDASAQPICQGSVLTQGNYEDGACCDAGGNVVLIAVLSAVAVVLVLAGVGAYFCCCRGEGKAPAPAAAPAPAPTPAPAPAPQHHTQPYGQPPGFNQGGHGGQYPQQSGGAGLAPYPSAPNAPHHGGAPYPQYGGGSSGGPGGGTASWSQSHTGTAPYPQGPSAPGQGTGGYYGNPNGGGGYPGSTPQQAVHV